MPPQTPTFYREASQSLANGKSNHYAQKLHGNSGYLDLINNIYSVPTLRKRKVSDALLANISTYFKERNSEKLFYECLKLDKFPYDDPQMGVVKEYYKHQLATLQINKKTISRIGQQLLNFSLEELLFLCRQPKVPNRGMGQKFKTWLNALDYPILDEKIF